MVINLNVPQSQPSTNLKVTLLIETLTSGLVAASVFEFPNCRVEAQTREEALTLIKTALKVYLTHLQTAICSR